MHDGAGVKVVVRGKMKLIDGSAPGEVVEAARDAIWATMDDKESGPGSSPGWDDQLSCRKLAAEAERQSYGDHRS
jgi:hypothetical protein